MEKRLIVSAPPHIKTQADTSSAMRDVVISLIPALLASIYFFGLNALLVIVSCIIAAILTEIGMRKIFGKKPTIWDGSAVVTGILLAFTLPAAIPWWIAAIGAFIAIAIAKEVFGGLGSNIFNPALVGRAFLLSSWGVFMTTWLKPLFWKTIGVLNFITPGFEEHNLKLFNVQGKAVVDTITQATPLAIVKQGLDLQIPSNIELFLGSRAGSLGETSVLALLIGAAYLLYKGHIEWRIPGSFIGSVFALSWILGRDPVFSIITGGLILGAFFMATDWVTSPITEKGKLIFGFGAGLLVVLIRQYGGFPEGVCYSILLMNAATPLIDRYTKPTKFGEVSA